MYAIIRAGGKQYRVQAGDTVRIEKIDRRLGDEFDVSDILLIGGDKTFVGEPVVKNAKVTVVVTQQAKSPKIIVFKKKRRQGYRRMAGHRQPYTELFVKSITTPDGNTIKTEKTAIVVDPVKSEQRKQAALEALAAKPKAERKAAQVKKVAKKKVAKKKAGPKKAAKKSAAKKTAKKKTSKKS